VFLHLACRVICDRRWDGQIAQLHVPTTFSLALCNSPASPERLPPTRIRYHLTASTPYLSIASKGSATLPFDLDIFDLFIVQCAWAITCLGGERPAAISIAGQ
jgi:hypothetical protein